MSAVDGPDELPNKGKSGAGQSDMSNNPRQLTLQITLLKELLTKTRHENMILRQQAGYMGPIGHSPHDPALSRLSYGGAPHGGHHHGPKRSGRNVHKAGNMAATRYNTTPTDHRGG